MQNVFTIYYIIILVCWFQWYLIMRTTLLVILHSCCPLWCFPLYAYLWVTDCSRWYWGPGNPSCTVLQMLAQYSEDILLLPLPNVPEKCMQSKLSLCMSLFVLGHRHITVLVHRHIKLAYSYSNVFYKIKCT